MDRVYGSTKCDICRKPASLGWLYACRQDKYAQRKLIASKIKTLYPTYTLDMADPEIRETLMLLADMGLSRSVIESATRGIYTPKQLDKIVTQKKRLQDLLAKQEQQYQEQKQAQEQKQQQQYEQQQKQEKKQEQQRQQKQHKKGKKQQSVSSTASSLSSSSVSTNSFSHLSRRPSSCTRRHSSHCRQDSTASLLANTGFVCDFQCCHACRPIYRDRIYQSVDAVFNDEVEPFHPSDIADLHVSDASLLCGIGLVRNKTEDDLIVPLINGMDSKTKTEKKNDVTASSALNKEESLPSNSGSQSSSGTEAETGAGTGASSDSSSELQVLEPVPIPMTPRTSTDEAYYQRRNRKEKNKKKQSKAEVFPITSKRSSSASQPPSRPSTGNSSQQQKSKKEGKTTVRSGLRRGLQQLVNGSKTNVSKRLSKDAELEIVSSTKTGDRSSDPSNRASNNDRMMMKKRDASVSNVSFLPSSVVAEAVSAVSKSGSVKAITTGTKPALPVRYSRANGVAGSKSSAGGQGVGSANEKITAKDNDKGLVEVMGGLALTEEAIETSVPDVTVQG